jgi:uncharacterized protein involved in type VI secretion and phage assembly
MYITLKQTRHEILELTGEERLSAPYKFTVAILAPTDYDIQDCLFDSIELNLNERVIGGIITSVETCLLDNLNNEQATITIEPTLALAANNTDNKIFQRQTIQEIITKLLVEAGYHPSLIKFHLAYPAKALAIQNQPYITQAGESSLQFINRLTAKAGLFYWHNYQNLLEEIHFSDDNDYAPKGKDIHYNPRADFDTPAMLTIEPKHKLVTTNITTLDHDYDYPNDKIIGKTNNKGFPQTYYGMGAKTTEETNVLANLLTQINQAEAFKVTGKSNISDLVLSSRVKLYADNYYLAPGRNLDLDVDGFYLIEHINHHLQRSQPYENTLGLHPMANQYKKPIPKPEVPSIFQARTLGGDEPEIDQDGSYFLKPEFARVDSPQLFNPIPKLAPHGDIGSKFADEAGWHTPIIGSVETLVSNLDGNQDRPIILGTLHDRENSSPILLKNDDHNILRSPGNNQLLMSDKYHAEELQLSTPEQANFLSLSAENYDNINTHKIDLTSQTGSVNMLAEKDMSLTSAANFNETSNDNYLQNIVGNHTTFAENLSQLANADYQAEATNNFRIEAAQNLTAKSGKDLNLTAQQIDLQNQTTKIIANQGSIAINTPNELKITAGSSLEFGQNGAGIKLTADNKIILNAKKINIKFDEIIHLGNTYSKVNTGELKLTDIPEINIPKDNADWGAIGRAKKKEKQQDENIIAMRFPLDDEDNDHGFTSGKRYFGAPRGERVHAGCDLYAPVGTEVRAVEKGNVLQQYHFREKTYALEIDHGDFLVRYGEIQPPEGTYENNVVPEKFCKGLAKLVLGTPVCRGDIIGYVGQRRKLNKYGKFEDDGLPMLHFELYKETKRKDSLTQDNTTYKYVPNKHYQRRSDLLDPTKSLEQAKKD